MSKPTWKFVKTQPGHQVAVSISIREYILLVQQDVIKPWDANREGDGFNRAIEDLKNVPFDVPSIATIIASQQPDGTLLLADGHRRTQMMLEKYREADPDLTKVLDRNLSIEVIDPSDHARVYANHCQSKPHVDSEKIQNPFLALGAAVRRLTEKAGVELDESKLRVLGDLLVAMNRNEGEPVTFSNYVASHTPAREYLNQAESDGAVPYDSEDAELLVEALRFYQAYVNAVLALVPHDENGYPRTDKNFRLFRNSSHIFKAVMLDQLGRGYLSSIKLKTLAERTASQIMAVVALARSLTFGSRRKTNFRDLFRQMGLCAGDAEMASNACNPYEVSYRDAPPAAQLIRLAPRKITARTKKNKRVEPGAVNVGAALATAARETTDTN